MQLIPLQSKYTLLLYQIHLLITWFKYIEFIINHTSESYNIANKKEFFSNDHKPNHSINRDYDAYANIGNNTNDSVEMSNANGAMSAAFRVAFNEAIKSGKANISSKAKFKKEQKGVDWNLFDKKTQPGFYSFGENVATEEGMFTIAAHGSRNSLLDGEVTGYKYFNASDIYNRLESKGWDGQQDIMIYACNVASGEDTNNFISKLSNLTKVNVYGPDSFIHVWQNGQWVVAPTDFNHAEAYKLKNGINNFLISKPNN